LTTLWKGTILAGERIDDGTPVNLGTHGAHPRNRPRCTWSANTPANKAEIKLRKDMPTGPLNRVADNALAKKLLNWEPKVPFKDGLKRTIDWYFRHQGP